MHPLSISPPVWRYRTGIPVGSLFGAIFCLILFSQLALPALLLAQYPADGVRASTEITLEENPVIMITSILVICIVPIISIGIISWFRYRNIKVLCRTIDRLLENGETIPDGLVAVAKPPHMQDRKRGILWIALGIGILGCTLIMSPGDWSLALIPVFLGIGYLVAARLQPG